MIPPPTHLRLEPGEVATVPIEVTGIASAAPSLRPGWARFTLQLEHAFGDGPLLSVDPAPVARAASRPRDFLLIGAAALGASLLLLGVLWLRARRRTVRGE